jgi:hypothetical protein
MTTSLRSLVRLASGDGESIGSLRLSSFWAEAAIPIRSFTSMLVWKMVFLYFGAKAEGALLL